MAGNNELNDILVQTLPPDPFATRASAPIPLDIPELPGSYLAFVESCWNSYGAGLLRFLIPGGTPPWDAWLSSGGWGDDWGAWGIRYFVFGYDWQARLLAFDFQRFEDGEPLVSMLDTATGKAMNSRSNFQKLIDFDIPTHYSRLLDEENLQNWIAKTGSGPLPHECVGFKVPLFLGGADEVENTEICDIDVYVSMQGQLFMAS